MPKLFHLFVGAAALLWIAAAANSQPQRYDGDRDDRYSRYGREPLDRVRADLNRAERDLNYLSEDEMRRFRRVREGIVDFQRNWERGRFDREALNQTIRGLESLVERSRLRPRDRDLLADDARRLREMRERNDRGGSGYRR